MPMTLPPELESQVSEWVRTGLYDSPTAVLSAALRLLDADEERRRQLADLRRAADEGLADADAGRVGPFDPLETLRRVRAGGGS